MWRLNRAWRTVSGGVCGKCWDHRLTRSQQTPRIVPPTSQNQACVEDDLRRYVQGRLDRDDAALTRECEQAIRNYDPCISCATHFLTLTVDRR